MSSNIRPRPTVASQSQQNRNAFSPNKVSNNSTALDNAWLTSTDPWKVPVVVDSNDHVWGGGGNSDYFHSTTISSNNHARPSPSRRMTAANPGRVPPSPNGVAVRTSTTAAAAAAPTTSTFRGRLMEGPTVQATTGKVNTTTVWEDTVLEDASEGNPWVTTFVPAHNNNNNTAPLVVDTTSDHWFVPPNTSSLTMNTTAAAVAVTTTQRRHPNVPTMTSALPLFDDSGQPVDRTPTAMTTTVANGVAAAPLGSSRRPILAPTTVTAVTGTAPATTITTTTTVVEDGTSKRPISIHDADLLDQREKDVLQQAARKKLPATTIVLEEPLSNNNVTRREADILSHAAAKRQQERTQATVLPNSYSASSTQSETVTRRHPTAQPPATTAAARRGGPNANTTPKQSKGFMGFFRGGVSKNTAGNNGL
jgi:hypothetical protein